MSFSLDLSRFVEKAGKAADKGVKKVCFDLTAKVIERTPVDTGRARANWQASIDTPVSGTTDDTDKNGSATTNAAVTAINNAAGRIFYLTNNLPYIVPLEYGLYSNGAGATQKTTRDGYSVKAPYGMARITIAEVARDLK